MMLKPALSLHHNGLTQRGMHLILLASIIPYGPTTHATQFFQMEQVLLATLKQVQKVARSAHIQHMSSMLRIHNISVLR
jgi:hypothetical protein